MNTDDVEEKLATDETQIAFSSQHILSIATKVDSCFRRNDNGMLLGG